MKILHITPSLAPEWGGPPKVIAGIAKALIEKGVETRILTTAEKGKEKRIVMLSDVPIRIVKRGFLSRFWIAYSPSITHVMREEIENCDLVHIHELWHYPHFAVYKVAKSFKKPFIISIHGELKPWCLNHKAFKKKIYSILIQRKILKEASALHAITEEEVKNISNFVDNKNVFLIANGINLEDFKNLPHREKFEDLYPELKGKKVILFLGRIHPIKGLDILAKAFSIISEYRENVRLVIAGPDENGYESKIKSILKKEGILNNVIFTGMLSGNIKFAALIRADIFIIPSYSEVRSITALEAMICGLPVIITKQCDFPEIGKYKAGMIIEPDINQLVRAFNYLLNNPKLCKEMGENGIRLVKESFTWDKIVNQMINLYEEVIYRSTAS